MQIDQRNAGASVTPSNADYTLDRYQTLATQTSKYSIQQNAGAVTPPTGFTNYLGVTSLSSYSVTSSDNFGIQQLIEGFNFADMAWGTANAQTVTLSFWVRSSLTGTFGGSIINANSTRSYPFSYTISAANTWEQKSITIAGDTTGTWAGATSNAGAKVIFGLGTGATLSGTAGAWAGANYRSATGATSVVGTNGATFYITGVQLEKGSTATSFDYRPYGTELALCQRYFQQLDATALLFSRWSASYQISSSSFSLPTVMRGTPTFSATGLSGKNLYNAATDANVISATPVLSLDAASTTSARLFASDSDGSLGGNAGNPLFFTTTGAICSFSAEL
jgi:hypothetical protein